MTPAQVLPPTRRRLLVSAVAVVVVAVCVAGYFAWRRSSVSTAPASLLMRLPTLDAAVVGIDFDTLRLGGVLGMLTGPKGGVEPEYQAFVRETGFDYTRDLDYVMASFSPDGTFLLVKGVFDWDKIELYTARNHGSCYEHVCRMQGSEPERKISFLPLRGNLMAMAVSTDDMAAVRLKNIGPQQDIDARAEPVWVSMSSGALRRARGLPSGSGLFASALADTQRITLTAGLSGGGFEARLEALCRDAQQAGALAGQLRTLTTFLRGSRKPGDAPNALGDTLASGTFEQADRTVRGHWTIDRSLIQTLAAGL